MMIRIKPRVRIGARDDRDRPIWHAVRGAATATGPNPMRALHNLIHVVPARRREA